MNLLERLVPRLALLALMTVTAAGLANLLAGHEGPRLMAAAGDEDQRLDPSAWGDDHVGEPLPDYVDGGECLFCHRNDVGTNWVDDKHRGTIRLPDDDDPALRALARNDATSRFAEQVKWIMGDTRHRRFLRPSSRYGKAEILSVGAEQSRPGRFRLVHENDPRWDSEKFAQRCAGCHTTAVDPELLAYSAVGHDCYSCHGNAPLEHSNDASLMPLARKWAGSSAAVISICGSCHVRFGKSRSTELPYPNNFVAGDNLFRDFAVDWAVVDDESMNPADRHVLDNVRDVALYGRDDLTCLSCHQIHTNSTAAHRKLAREPECACCHDPEKPLSEHVDYEVHSPLCEY